MTKEVPSQVMRASIKMSRLLSESLMNSPFPRLETLKAFDKIAVAEGINSADLNLPGREENLLTHLAFRKLDYPDEKQMLGVFEYVFEKKQCDPNHVIKVEDTLDQVATAFFNESRNMYVNTFLHTLIANEHRSASGRSLVEDVLDLPHIKKNFNFNKKDVIIEGPEGKEKEGKTILCLSAKMKEAGIVRKLCALKKEGLDINLDLKDEHGRTALFYSCALGDLESTKALLEAGAKANLVDQASINSFQNNRTEVENILKSVAIDPDRDEKALSNFFVHPNNHQAQLFDNLKINKRNEATITSAIERIINKPTKYEQGLTGEVREEFVKFAKVQILDSKGNSFLTGTSLLDSCLEGQAKCLELLSRSLAESPPVSIPSTEGKPLAPPDIRGRTQG